MNVSYSNAISTFSQEMQQMNIVSLICQPFTNVIDACNDFLSKTIITKLSKLISHKVPFIQLLQGNSNVRIHATNLIT